MPTTDYRPPSDLKEFHRISCSDEERRNAASVSTEQILRRVPEGASPMQHRIPQVVNQHPVDARHADVSRIGRDQHLQVINLNVFNIHHRLNGTNNEREDTAGNYRGFLTFGGIVFIGAILVAYHHFAR